MISTNLFSLFRIESKTNPLCREMDRSSDGRIELNGFELW